MTRNQIVGAPLLFIVVVIFGANITGLALKIAQGHQPLTSATPKPPVTKTTPVQATVPVVVQKPTITTGRTFQCRHGRTIASTYENATAQFMGRSGSWVTWRVTTPQKTTTFKVDPRYIVCSFIN
jgi:hypothetical protein